MTIAPALKALFSRRGRLDRRGFSSLGFGICLAFCPVGVLGTLADKALHPDQSPPEGWLSYVPPHDLAQALVIVALALYVVLVIAMLSISVRRFHDLSLSGWAVLLAGIVVVFLPKVDVPLPFDSVWLWVWFAALSALPGSPETNEYGPGRTGSETEARP